MIQHVERFFDENVGRRAEETIRHYSGTLYKVCEWLGTCGIEDLSEVTPDLLVRWLNLHPNWSASTRYGAIAAMRAFFKWALGADNPAVKLVRPKRPTSSHRRALKPDEASKLLAYPDTSTVKGIRDLAILSVMMDTGVRAGELCSIKLDDLSLEDRSFQVVVKGGRWEWAVFSEHTEVALAEWLSVREDVANLSARTVFVATTHSNKGRPLNNKSLHYLITKLSRDAGIGKICPHELRHTFAEISLRAGAPTRILQKGGRWRDIRQVERYTQRIELEAFRPYFPMSFLMEEPISTRQEAP